MKKFLFPAFTALMMLPSCVSGSSQKDLEDSVAQVDTLMLIEKEILHSDSLRLDSLRRDSAAKAGAKAAAGDSLRIHKDPVTSTRDSVKPSNKNNSK